MWRECVNGATERIPVIDEFHQRNKNEIENRKSLPQLLNTCMRFVFECANTR